MTDLALKTEDGGRTRGFGNLYKRRKESRQLSRASHLLESQVLRSLGEGERLQHRRRGAKRIGVRVPVIVIH